MGSGTLSWEPANLVKLGSDSSNWGKEIEGYVSEIYSTFNNLGISGFWTGANYNTVANLWNSFSPTFVEAMTYFVDIFPKTMYDIAGQQAAGSDADPGQSTFQAFITGYNVAPTPDDGTGKLVFDPAEYEIAEGIITADIESANALMDRYSNEAESVLTASMSQAAEAREPSINAINNFVRSCKNAFEQMKETLVTEAQKCITKQNEANAAAGQSAENLSNNSDINVL